MPGFLGGTAAALAAGTAVNVAALATIRPAAAASDPILAAIEAHKTAAAVTVVVHRQFSAFENELADNERLQRDRRKEDETRRGEELETAIEEAFHFEQVAAYDLLDVKPTTAAGVVALLTYAIDHDDREHGMGWPDAIGIADEPCARSWQFFLIQNMAEILPKLLVSA